MPDNHLIITGPPGSGKTTLVRRVAENLNNLRLAGFFTEEVRKAGHRVGFRLVPFSGAVQPRMIAHRDFISNERVGRYGVDVEAVSYASDMFLGSAERSHLTIIDEIGKMECMSSRFESAVRRLLSADHLVIATVSEKGGGLMAEAREGAGNTLWKLDAGNRDAMVRDVLAWVKQRL